MWLQAPAFTHAAGADERLRLQIEQQHDALDLTLQQSMGTRADLSARDSGALGRLQLDQRLERQQLEQQQLLQEHLTSRNRASLPADALQRELESQRASFALERQLQAQRFGLDQQRLLQSMSRQPLQPPRVAGQHGLQ
jgi:hypothetical protein